MKFQRELVDPAGVPEDGTIGVVVSGGFDSTVLWHIVYGICQERGQKCIPFTVPKNDGALRYAIRMLEWSQHQHEMDKQLHPIVVNSEGVDWMKTDYQGPEVTQQLTGGIAEIIKEGYADYVFVGVNEYPPHHETLCDYHTPGPRNLSRDSNAEWEGRKAKDVILNPFADMTNPYRNMGVATQAAEMQAQQTDQALANTLDTLAATGASAGGAQL